MDSKRYQLLTRWILRYMRNQTVTLNNDALEFYGKLLCVVAAGDGVLSPEEREWIVGYRAVSGVADEVLDMLRAYDPTSVDWKSEVKERSKFVELCKYSIIHDAFQAAAADDELHADERKAISELGEQIGVDEKIIEQIAQLHKDEIEFKKQRLALLFPMGVNETIRKAKAAATK